MCGRFSLTATPAALAQAFGLSQEPVLVPRFNVAPGQEALAVRAGAGGVRTAGPLRWGLIPSWAKDPAIASRLINARAETAAQKPSFRSALRRRRCLVPADGYYEWRREGRARRPHLFTLDGGAPFALAGLWESWTSPEGEAVESFTLLTTGANALAATVHDRMPVILDAADYPLWLDAAATDAAAVEPLLRPFPAARMAVREVSRFVNDARHEGPGCHAPPE